jgi:hypothetical protein
MVKELEHPEMLFNLLQEWEIKYFIYFTQNKNKNDKNKNLLFLSSKYIIYGSNNIYHNKFYCFSII